MILKYNSIHIVYEDTCTLYYIILSAFANSSNKIRIHSTTNKSFHSRFVQNCFNLVAGVLCQQKTTSVGTSKISAVDHCSKTQAQCFHTLLPAQLMLWIYLHGTVAKESQKRITVLPLRIFSWDTILLHRCSVPLYLMNYPCVTCVYKRFNSIWLLLKVQYHYYIK